ncbi:MAG: pyridoxal-phosphate dependent enzyme [Actinomycetota bacterium]
MRPAPQRATPQAVARDIFDAAPPIGSSIWRYRSSFGLVDPDAAQARLSLGEGGTPLVAGTDAMFPGMLLKVEFVSPTLSFKDRGAAVVVAHAIEQGAERLVCDSSGNAGTAIAAYAARAGLLCTVYVPAGTSPAKMRQAEGHGAQVVRVDGDRSAAAVAAEEAVTRGDGFYASHVWQPSFLAGTKTFAFEVWEQLGRRVPERLVLPVGNGTLVLGAWLGFEELRLAGLVDDVPPITAVQSAACAPIAAHAAGRSFTSAPTIAEGIAVASPPRISEVIDVVVSSGGELVTVDDDEIVAAQSQLASAGWFVEPTGAVAFAAAHHMDRDGPGGRVVVPLCGAGLKSPGR